MNCARHWHCCRRSSVKHFTHRLNLIRAKVAAVPPSVQDAVGYGWNIARELGRLYRAGLSGRVNTAEAARLVFILKELRGALESEREAAVINMPVGSFGDLIVSSVPPRQDLGARPATSTAARSFDHLVGDGEHAGGNSKAKRCNSL